MNQCAVPYYVFNSPFDADEAIQTLNRSGLDVKKLSVVGKDNRREEQPFSFTTSTDRIKSWGGTGAFWGGIWGLILAPAIFVLPGVGIVAIAGPLAGALVGALEGAIVVGSMSALGAALTQIGISTDQVPKCETAVKRDNFVLMVHGDTDEVASARAVLTQLKIWT